MRRTARSSPHLVAGAGFAVLVVALVVALVGMTAFAIGVGTVDVPVGRVAAVVRGHLRGGTAGLDPLTDQIVWEFRTPRVLLAAVAGGELSLAGVCLQCRERWCRGPEGVRASTSGLLPSEREQARWFSGRRRAAEA